MQIRRSGSLSRHSFSDGGSRRLPRTLEPRPVFTPELRHGTPDYAKAPNVAFQAMMDRSTGMRLFYKNHPLIQSLLAMQKILLHTYLYCLKFWPHYILLLFIIPWFSGCFRNCFIRNKTQTVFSKKFLNAIY